MNIAEMHVWFRQYAQQMGMQNVRAILPEQIDVVINTSISDTTNQIIRESVGLTNDRIITDNSKVGQVNALRNLYVVKETPFTGQASQRSVIVKDTSDSVYEVYKCKLSDLTNGDLLYAADFSIKYKIGNTKNTSWFPIRIIDDMYLADTLNDYVLSPRFRSPIVVIFNRGTVDTEGVTYDTDVTLYIDKSIVSGSTTILPHNLIPNTLRFSYIKKPAIVKYLDDINGTSVDCDLPESMHVDILKHAVDLYNISVRGGMYNRPQPQQEQTQQQPTQ